MPEFGGFEALDLVRSLQLDIPFILVSGTINENVAIEAMRRGAADYILKNNMARLGPAVRRDLAESENRIKMRRAQAELCESEERFRELFNGMSHCGMILHPVDEGRDFYIVGINHALETLECVSSGMLQGKLLGDNFIHRLPDGFLPILQRVYNSGAAERITDMPVAEQDSLSWRDGYVFRLSNQDVVVIYNDITEKKQAEEKMIASLHEKEILLKEIHHRVKNNMQLVSSMLSLQMRYIRDEEDRELLQDSRNRIHSMALIHEKIYRSQDLARIDFNEYVNGLAAELINVYRTDSTRVRLNCDVRGVFLSLDEAIPCAQIINEILSNSLKYAFPDGRDGVINLSFAREEDGIYNLEIGDNGVGLPDAVDVSDPMTLGLRLVDAFVTQIKGTMNVIRESGVRYTIRFRCQ